jgi:beta-N-acetylhexosaminidase
MSMSGLTLYFDQEEAGVRAFLAGTDILEKPSDVDAMIRGLKNGVASGRIPASRLDESVRRQLAWKYELGLTKQKITPLDRIDRIVSGPEAAKLADEIAEKAITLVRQEEGILPAARDTRIAVLGISNGFDGPSTMAPFAATLRQNRFLGPTGDAGSRGQTTSVYLQENSLPAQVEAAQKAVAEADIVIVGLYGRVRSGARNSVGIPENGAAILREALAANKKVIGVSFGNPYILSSFPEMQTYIVAYGDMPSLQRAAARAILGQQAITGRLPISLPGLHPRGTGVQFSPGVKLTSAPRPAYPINARVAKVTGDVKIEVSIDPKGNVSSTRLIEGNSLLREVSIAAAKRLKFISSVENSTRFSLVIYRFKSNIEPYTDTCCENYPYVISVYPY